MRIKNLSAEIEKAKIKLEKAAVKQTSLLVPAMIVALENRTPIDTGLARSSWKYSISKDKAVIQNTVPYIEYLNKGSSKQAPAYFIESTALAFGKPKGSIVRYY